MPVRTSPAFINELMKEFGIQFKKKFGQNFLIDSNITEKIVESMDISEENQVLEIGPGLGSLTEVLLRKTKNVSVVEIDRALASILERDFEGLHVINEDILKVEPERFPAGIKICGNLPYYITSAIIMHFLESDLKFHSLTLMMQREVAKRIVSKVGSKEYGVLTVIMSMLSEVDYLFDVKATCFMPKPNVDSAIIRVRPKDVELPKELITLIKQSFAKRRKTLQNNLSEHYSKEALEKAFLETDIKGYQRAETLSPDDFLRLHEALIRIAGNRI